MSETTDTPHPRQAAPAELGSEAGHDIVKPPKKPNYILRRLGVLAAAGLLSTGVGAGIAKAQDLIERWPYPQEIGTTIVEIQPGEGGIDVIADAFAQIEASTGNDIPASSGDITIIGNGLDARYRGNHNGKEIPAGTEFRVTVTDESFFIPGVTVIAEKADQSSSTAKE